MDTNGREKTMRERGAICVIWHVLLCLILSAIILLGTVIALSPKDRTVTDIVISNATGMIATYAILVFSLWVLMDKLFCIIDYYIQTNAGEQNINDDALHKAYSDGLKIAAIIFLCWSPYLIICYPTITRGYDFFWQLLQGMGLFPLSNHHPVIGSFVFGAIFRIGYAIGGASFGLALISLVQMLLMSLSMGYAFAVLRIIAVIPRKLYFILVAYVCLCPVFPGHSVWAIKDSIFTAITILLITQFLLHIWCITHSVSIPSIASLPSFTITSILFALYRNGTVPIVVTIFLVLLFFDFKTCRNKVCARRSVVALMVFLIAVFSWGRLMSAIDVYPTNIREALSLPTRQIVRTLQMHPEELDGESEAYLKSLYHDQIANGTDISSIIDNYDDYNADYIKIDYVSDDNFLPAFLRYWIRLGMRHPGSYVDAMLRGTDGYWFYGHHPHLEAKGIIIHTVCTTGPEDDFANEAMLDMQLKALFLPTVRSLEYAGADTNRTFSELCKEQQWLNDFMHVKSAFPTARGTLGDCLAKLENTPIISLILAPGSYFLIMIICFGYMFERRKIGRLLWPVILLEALAWLSPINGYTRYVLPLELLTIILIGICMIPEDTKDKTDENLYK